MRDDVKPTTLVPPFRVEADGRVISMEPSIHRQLFPLPVYEDEASRPMREEHHRRRHRESLWEQGAAVIEEPVVRWVTAEQAREESHPGLAPSWALEGYWILLESAARCVPRMDTLDAEEAA